MKPLQIGETTTYKGVELVCVEDETEMIKCDSTCYFNPTECNYRTNKFRCSPYTRPDNKSVHFEVKEGK